MNGRIFYLASLLLAGVVSAATIHVPGDQPTIQAGIDASASGDTVSVAAGTYSGTGNYNLDFGGRNIVLRAESGPNTVIVDCAHLGRGIYFHSRETAAAQVLGLTFVNGWNNYGGGIRVDSLCSPVFKNCVVHACQSTVRGGGVDVYGASPTFTNCVFHSNFSAMGGGFSAENSSASVNSCILAANTSSG
jgi:hypothetical protein